MYVIRVVHVLSACMFACVWGGWVWGDGVTIHQTKNLQPRGRDKPIDEESRRPRHVLKPFCCQMRLPEPANVCVRRWDATQTRQRDDTKMDAPCSMITGVHA